MDNLTHSLIGLAAAKAGLEKLSPGATTLCVIAANVPDVDVITLAGGRWFYLQNHRGITHSLAGTFILALLLPLVFYLVDKLIANVRKRTPVVRLKGLLIASLLVSATHPFMDWTNNYGIRPLLPRSSRWFYGDFVFIIDPFLWLILGGAAFLMTARSRLRMGAWLIIALIPTYLIVIGPGRRGAVGNPMVIQAIWIIALVAFIVLFLRHARERWGRAIPVTALALSAVYLAGLCFAHTLALRTARAEAAKIALANNERVIDFAAMPVAANPFDWLCVLETDKAAYRYSVSLIGNDMDQQEPIRHPRPEEVNRRAYELAAEEYRTKVFLGFARFPVAHVAGEDCLSQTLVQFADLRYTEPGSGRGTFSLEVPVACPQPHNE